MKTMCKFDEMISVEDLKPYALNRNVHPPDQIKRLAKLLKYQGVRAPIVVARAQGVIAKGHGTLDAIKLNGWKKAPVVYQDFDTDEQLYAFVQSDNSIATWADLDLSGINTDIGEFGPDFDIDLLGIKDFKVDVADRDITTDESGTDEDDANLDDESIAVSEEIEQAATQMILDGDCLDRLKSLPANSADSLVTDPPAGISFMGKEWDNDKGGRKQWCAWMESVMRECFRVMKPGSHGLVWALPRTSHWTATALEDSGFEIRDIVTHLFGQGFPKSLAIDKAIDKMHGDERPVVGKHSNPAKTIYSQGAGQMPQDVPITSAASAAWEGWGTALKPASEHWILIRKPISEKSIAANVLRWGTGAINIDGTRVGTENMSHEFERTWNPNQGEMGKRYSQNSRETGKQVTSGRFPANLVLTHAPGCTQLSGGSRGGSRGGSDTAGFQDSYIGGKVIKGVKRIGYESEQVESWSCTDGCAIKELDEQSGISKSPPIDAMGGGSPNKKVFGKYAGVPHANGYGDSGGASRFFYCAKISASERNEGMEGQPDHIKAMSGGAAAAAARGETEYGDGSSGGYDRIQVVKNHHPTVKPIKLMRYFCRMVTPSGGVILDPFAGSGSTGIAAIREGFRFIGIEKQSEYIAIGRRRLAVAMELLGRPSP